MKNMIEIKNLSKTYGKTKKAVDNISLNVKEGEVFGFIGHNGAGKTTTIKSIMGILNFEEGDILIDGKSIKKDAMECKKIMAYLPDNPELYENLTGIQFVNFICDMYEVPKNQRENSIIENAKRFKIYDNLNDEISSYSHGMKQKIALIAALAHNPKILILDEPFVGLDPTAVFDFKKVMKELTSNGGCVFFSTHILDVAEKLCDKIAIIKDGKIVASGTMEEVKGNKSLENVFLELYKKG